MFLGHASIVSWRQQIWVTGQLVSESTRTSVNSYLFSVNSYLLFGQLVPFKSILFSSWVLIFCVFLHESIWCGYSLELPPWSPSNEYFVTGEPNWYWLTVGQGLPSLQQVRVEGECCYFFCSFTFFHFPFPSLSLSLFSLFKGDDTKWPTRVHVSLNHNTINLMSTQKHIFVWRNQENVYLDIPFFCSYAEWLLKLDNMIRQPKFDKGTSWLRYELTKVRVDQKWVRVD